MEFVKLTQGHIEDFEEQFPKDTETLSAGKSDGEMVRAAIKAGWIEGMKEKEADKIREWEPQEVMKAAREIAAKYNEARTIDPN